MWRNRTFDSWRLLRWFPWSKKALRPKPWWERSFWKTSKCPPAKTGCDSGRPSLPATRPAQAPRRYAKWMGELKAYHRGELDLKTYDSREGVAERLMKTNRRLGRDQAQWLAGHWAREAGDGRWHILGDAAHKIINASLFRVDEVLEIYQSISAPVPRPPPLIAWMFSSRAPLPSRRTPAVADSNGSPYATPSVISMLPKPFGVRYFPLT